MAKENRKKWTDSDRALAFLIVKYYCSKLGNKFKEKDGRDVSESREISRTSDSWNIKIQNYIHASELLAGKHVNKPHVGGCIKSDINSPSGWRGEYVEVSIQANSDPKSFIELALREWKNRDIATEIYASFAGDISASSINDFSAILRNHITSAATEYYSGKRLDGFSKSTTYDILLENLRYPPKMIMGMAYKQATGKSITGSMFDGGLNTPCFKRLEELGFKLVPKSDRTSQFMKITNKLSTACCAKQFTILAGGTGTGKTRAARQLAIQIAGVENVATVAVGSDWTDNRPLLGFRNLLSSDGKSYVVPAALKLILKANTNLREAENSAKMGDLPKGPNNQIEPYFLILDEMNLSHVERYFADFLSSMESHEPLKLHDCIEGLKSDGTNDIVPHEVAWPKNLFIIGTVNIDETTYMFSPKVLDRAHVIEFKVPWDENKDGLTSPPAKSLPRWEPSKTISFINIALNKDKSLDSQNQEKLLSVLEDLYECLEGTRFNFAHRSARECLNYVATSIELSNAKLAEVEDIITLIDLAILQKALPKINGSTGSLSNVLEALVLFSNKHKLTNCETKLKSMREQLKSDQFVSFIQ